jgi:nondiscriminating glutamyl-tRNA synthetase
MQVSHVLRGEDHLSNTPRQRLLLRRWHCRPPLYGHVSLLLGDDGAPLSKRHGATSVRELREAGYSSAAVCNHLFRLGHSTPLNQMLTLAADGRGLRPAHLQRAPAHFELAQLRHWQSEWVHSLSAGAGARLAQADPAAGPDARAGRCVHRRGAAEHRAGRGCAPVAADHLRRGLVLRGAGVANGAEAGPEFFAAAANAVSERADIGALRSATGRKGAAFFMPLRAALTGRLHGPELAPLLAAMPAERVRARLLHSRRCLKQRVLTPNAAHP